MPKRWHDGKTQARKKPQEPDFAGVVRDLASDGRAVVAHPDGRAFLVAGAWLGERLRVRPLNTPGRMAQGMLVEVIEPSAVRVDPVCGYQGFGAGDCGGCGWGFVSYDAQCAAKVARIQQRVEQLGATDSVIQPFIPSDQSTGYRNRAQLKTDGQRLGYLAAGSHQLIDVEHCPVLTPANQSALARLRGQLPNQDWRPARRRDQWRTIDIDDQIEQPSLDQRLPFRQGNDVQNARMCAWLADQITALDANASVMELFAGSGNFTSILVNHFSRVLAVEGHTTAVEALTQLSERVTARAVDLFNEAAVIELARLCADIQVLVLDPPRDGLKIRAPFLEVMKQLETIVYISCDSATWARDCRDFITAGFELTTVQPIDLFPQTPHVEVLSVLKVKSHRR